MKAAISTLKLAFITLWATPATWAATSQPISGRVIDEQGEAISYATVVLSSGDKQAAGGVTDGGGFFSFEVVDGSYELLISYVGYTEYRAQVEAGEQLGKIALHAESTQVGEVVVTSNFIRREADRFVLDVASSPSAIGQDGEELLKGAPGVWITDDEISINGNSSPKIYINDRELKMSTEQLLIYLRNLKSEDVRRVEVVPLSGAEEDADSASGAIKIYLKRQVEAGMVGSVTMRSAYSEYITSYTPSASVNYQSQRLTLNTSLWYNDRSSSTLLNGSTAYNSGAQLTDTNSSSDKSQYVNGRIEAIYELDDKQSVAAEVSLYDNSAADDSDFCSDMLYNGSSLVSNGNYTTTSSSLNLSATFNYIYKLDTLGSTIKLLADHNRNSSDNYTDSQSTSNGVDSLYRAVSNADYKVSTVSLAYEKVASPKLTLKSGIKYTFNDMDSHSLYTHLDGSQWQESTGYNSSEIYTEKIGAAYLSTTSRLGRWGVVAGLRAEYTSTSSQDGELDKEYLSLFPNANISYSLNEAGSNSIVLQYARSIRRPNFWNLNPQRTQISEYSYQIGNPSLKAEYSNSVNMTFVYKYKYSLTASVNITQNGTQQVVMQDANDPNVSYIQPINFENQKSYALSANLPFQLTKWWSLSANATYVYRGETIDSTSDIFYQNMLFVNAHTTFTLPHDFFITSSLFRMSDVYSGNMQVKGRTNMSLSLKKQFADKRFTASFSASSLFGESQKITSTTDSMTQYLVSTNAWGLPRVGFSLSYNFKAGREYRHRAGVESASGDDKSRISSGE